MEKFIAKKIQEFKRKTNFVNPTKDHLLYSWEDNSPMRYPESEYELDVEKVKEFLSKSLEEAYKAGSNEGFNKCKEIIKISKYI